MPKVSLEQRLQTLVKTLLAEYDISDTNYIYAYQSSSATNRVIRNRWVKKLLDLIPNMERANATYNEMRRILIFSHTVLDCHKYKLSVNLAYDDLHIDELTTKYYISKED